MPLSTEDRVAIHELYARFTHTFATDPEAWGNVFSPDGGFAYLGRDGERHGRETLVAWAREWHADAIKRDGEGVRYLQFTSNVAIDETGDGARGTAYVLVLVVSEAGLRFNCVGVYHDELVLTDDGWRFGRRRFDQLSSEKLRGQFLQLAPGKT